MSENCLGKKMAQENVEEGFVGEDDPRSVIMNITNPDQYISSVEMIYAIRPYDASM